MRSVGICAFVAVLLLTSSVCAAQVFLKDHSGLFVSDTISDLELTAEGIAATISTLGGRSVLTIDANAATQVAAIAKPGIFTRPSAVLTVHVIGADGDQLSLAGWAQHSMAPCCDADRVARHLVLATPMASHPECDSACAQQRQQELMSTLGSHAAGVLSRFGADIPPLLLGSGSGAEERLWAGELAAALQQAQHGGAARQYGWTLVGLQAVRQKYGAGAEVFQAAQAATLAVLTRLDARLADRHDGRLVTVVVASPPVALPTPTLHALLKWKDTLDQNHAAGRWGPALTCPFLEVPCRWEVAAPTPEPHSALALSPLGSASVKHLFRSSIPANSR